MRYPLVTVIVPAFNYGRFVAQTLESVRAQKYANWECCVIDDGSTDDTREVVTPYAARDPRIHYIWQKNAGLAAARNTGITRSAGEYLQFLDADDLIESGKLGFQVEYLERNHDVGIVFGEARYFTADEPWARLYSPVENQPWVMKLSGQGKEVLLALLRGNIMVVNSPLVRRQVVRAVGLFDGRIRGVEDYDYWVRCAVSGTRFHFGDDAETHALVRSHPASMSRDSRLMIRSTLLMHRKIGVTVTDPDILRLNSRRIAELEGLLGVEEVVCGRSMAGVYRLFRASLIDKRTRSRAKWLFCAAAAPFVSGDMLKRLVGSSLTGAYATWLRSFRVR